MAYTTGGTIQALDYNLLAWGGNTTNTYTSATNNLAVVWGIGTGQFGYGQDVSLISAVTASSTVTATQWAGLVYTVNKTLGHQAGTAALLTGAVQGGNIGIVAGATITAFANVATAVTTVNTNKLNFNSTRGSTTASGNFDATFSTGTFTQTITVTFGSADQARYYFNAGGRFNLVFSPSSLTDNAKETSYNDLMNAIGTLSLDALTSTRSGSGETQTTNGLAIGYWDLTTSNQTILKLTSDNSTYTGNTLEVFMRVAGAGGSNGGLGTQVIYDITYTDGADEAFDDAVSGIFRHRIDVIRPEVTYLADVWGTITVS
jgi:hypothetical protein